ncbi:MAG TPA: AAA family ATPase [Abditibacterium sp.]|jgi:predicted kinase
MQALIFIGMPGAGKSTFARTRFFDTHLRLNFDQLKTRNREAILLRACLESKTPFVWDNTSPTRAVRAPLLEQLQLARFEAVAFYFEPDFAASWERNARRQGKARVPLVGVKSVAAQLEKPAWDEGFAAIFSVWNRGEAGFEVEEWRREI